MRSLTLQLVFAVMALGFAPRVTHAQAKPGSASACRPADSTSARMVTWLTNVVTGTDSATVRRRIQLKLPQVAPSQITYVTDKNVCSKALSPYNANSGIQDGGATVTPSGKLYVVKVGTVYVAKDPVKTWGEFVIYVTLDSRFRLLARNLG